MRICKENNNFFMDYKGILREKAVYSVEQEQTKDAFSFKLFSEGVLHHTDSPKKAVLNLSNSLTNGEYFLLYVYSKKAPVREFTDDYIRDYFKDRSNEETWEGLRSLTKLGKQLGDLKIMLNIEDEIPVLGIKSGEIDLQRFFY